MRETVAQMPITAIRCFLFTGACLCLCFFAGTNAEAATTVTFVGTTAQKAQLQTDFIAFTTTYWTSTVSPGFFAGDSRIAISTRTEAVPPVLISSPIFTASAFEECMAFGLLRGLDYARFADKEAVYGAQVVEVSNRTCGGMPLELIVSSFTVTSTTTVHVACMNAYNVAVSTINLMTGCRPVSP